MFARFIRKSTPGQSITPERRDPPHRGAPNLTFLSLDNNPFGISGCALIAAAACGTGAIEGRDIAEKVSKSSLKTIKSVEQVVKKLGPQVKQKDYLPPNMTITEIGLADCMCEHTATGEIPMKLFEQIFMGLRPTQNSKTAQKDVKGKQKETDASSGSALDKATTVATQLESERRQQVGILANAEFIAKAKKDATVLHKVWKVMRSGCWSSQLTNRQQLNTSNCIIWKVAFQVLAGARVLSCNVKPGKKKGGKSHWWKLPAEIRKHVLGFLSDRTTVPSGDTLTQEQLTAVLSFASDRRTIGYGSTNEAVIAEKRLMDEKTGRDGSAAAADFEFIAVPKWSWHTSPAHPPYDWPSEVKSGNTHAHTCRSRLSAAGRAFLCVTDTVMFAAHREMFKKSSEKNNQKKSAEKNYQKQSSEKNIRTNHHKSLEKTKKLV